MLFERASKKVQAEQGGQARATGGSGRSKAGMPVTPESALTVSAVLAAFTVLAEDSSSLPLILYQRNGETRQRATGSSYYRLMHDRPNPEHGSMVFRELIMAHLLAWGNFYGQLIINSAGDVTEIWPLRPDRMTVKRANGQKVYLYQRSDGGKPLLFTPDMVLHIPAFGFDGLVGYSRIALARNAIGLAMATETYGSTWFANGARPSVALKTPNKLSQPAYDRLKESWVDDKQGVEKSNGVAILEEGLDIATLSVPPEDAQFLETRKFQVTEIARIFRIPPHMLGDVERSTSWGSGIDSQEQGYINHTLRPWMIRIEQGLNGQLLLDSHRSQGLYYEHLLDALLRGDIQTRYEMYVKAINNGIMSPNETRARENLNPYEGGDVYYRPLNIADANGQATASSAQAIGLDRALEIVSPVLADACLRIQRRERNDVLAMGARAKGDADNFTAQLDGFALDHLDFATRQLHPVAESLARMGYFSVLPGIDKALASRLSLQIKALHSHDAQPGALDQLYADPWLAESARQLHDQIKQFIAEQAILEDE